MHHLHSDFSQYRENVQFSSPPASEVTSRTNVEISNLPFPEDPFKEESWKTMEETLDSWTIVSLDQTSKGGCMAPGDCSVT